ncbi:helix-turn-helix domain-containing protein [Actinomadura bangladeshensis]|uniref:Helix-turn-helix domain-containing protein n=1 Tax=Actinomadura bangladeshensis TaxID=453573 RepID=A0A6L9QK12_9ACTN|nr:helix-turn-helix transcriptional regulator [Actinomadura bangladeshensis]NEA25820.1 helix-turn-helix domain-containing protein [Actinomadura bangladeshensis]
MPVEHGPTARHRRLAAELRRLREAANLTPEVAAGILGWSRTKLVRIETATIMPRVVDVGHIVEAYGGPGEIRTALLELARGIRNRGWWAAFDDVLAGGYVELEDAANRIRSWQTEAPPGLLQTPGYARTLIAGEYPHDQDEVDRRLQARMARRARLARTDAPQLDVVLAEETLRRPVGGPVVMAGQLAALLEAAKQPSVSLRVVPTALGYRPGLGQGSMVVFEFAAPLELDTAYVETMAGGMYIEDVMQVRRCSSMLDRIAGVAMSQQESVALIAAIREEFQAHVHAQVPGRGRVADQ